MKTQSDIDKVLEAKRKEKVDREAAEKRVKELEGDIGGLNDKIKVYESDDSKKLSAQERVELERLKRENETLTGEKSTLQEKFDGLNGQMTASQIKAELAKSAKGIVRDEAIDDVVDILSKDFVLSDGKVLTNTDLGDKSGLEAKAYLSQYAEGRPYLAPTSSGGGSGGDKGSGGGTQTTLNNGEIQASSELWGDK
jgi:ABC-type lipopolysaccharide export system ATPase subunit